MTESVDVHRSSRLFFALWPDLDMRNKLTQFSLSLPLDRFNRVPAHNYHVTLVFLGQVNSRAEQALKKFADTIIVEPFSLIFDRISYWTKPRVISLTARQPAQQAAALAQLLTDAAASCGVQTDSRPYIPHVTLARKVLAFPEKNCHPIVWPAHSFCLVESCNSREGVIYNVKAQWPRENQAGDSR